jgi:hypothetical protein
MFTGSDQVPTVLAHTPTLGTGLVLAMFVGKTLAFAARSASGFVDLPFAVHRWDRLYKSVADDGMTR